MDAVEIGVSVDRVGSRLISVAMSMVLLHPHKINREKTSTLLVHFAIETWLDVCIVRIHPHLEDTAIIFRMHNSFELSRLASPRLVSG